ncbi:hypothetical protein [Nostoc sp. MG11]|uniref:hypothetical protein n=1 Tax=Nostoc sp. MG11 TaxID=2721166 RepID=UPI001868CF38|nr:hypothetical protein [Nostoc sp. MG11]
MPTRADYLEQIVRDNTLPSITRDEEQVLPSNTWGADALSPCITPNNEHPQTSTTLLPQLEALEALRDRILLELKLGKQATGYKTALKALNRFIAELTNRA